MNEPTPDYELLSAYLDDELSAEERARVEERLATDPKYAATLNAFRDQRMRLRSLPRNSIDVRQHVMNVVSERASLATSASDERSSSWRLNPWLIASLAALILLGVFLFLPDFGQQQVVVKNEVLADSTATKLVASDEFGGEEIVDAAEESNAATGKQTLFGSGLETVNQLNEEADESLLPALGGRGQSMAKKGVRRDAVRRDADRRLRESKLPKRFAADPGLAEADASRPSTRSSSTVKLQDAAFDDMDLEESALAPTEGVAQRQLKAKNVPQSRAASSAPMLNAVPPGSIVGGFADEQLADKQLAQSGAAALPRMELANKPWGSESYFAERASSSGFATARGVMVSERFEERLDRTWNVASATDKSSERLTIARFRKALDQAGCEYRELKQLSSASQSSGGRKSAEKLAGVSKPTTVVNFIVVATPEQLVKLRKLAGSFAELNRADVMLGATTAVEQGKWDGSRLSREDGLDPAGDGRVYRFTVHPSKEPLVKPAAPSGLP